MREDRAYSEELLNILTVERIRNAALFNKVAQLVPKAIYHDIILQCPDAVQVSIIAKDYGMSAVACKRQANFSERSTSCCTGSKYSSAWATLGFCIRRTRAKATL